MAKRTDKKRNPPKSVRLPVGTEDEFEARRARSGKSQNAFIVDCIFQGEPPRAARRPVIEQKLVAQLLSQAARLHNDLHEISLMAGESPAIVLRLEQANAELIAIRSALFEACGRKP